MTERKELTDEQIEQAWEACDRAESGTLKVWILAARWAESIIAADRALQGEQEAPKNDWLIDGSLLYRLNDDIRPSNCDEINVTMAHGSRAEDVKNRRALALLEILIAQGETE